MSKLSGGKTAVTVFGVLIVLASLAFGFSVMTTDLNLTVQLAPTGIHVQHNGAILMKATDREIAFSDITNYQLFNQLPALRKTNGLDNSKLRIGKFSATGVGDLTAYVNNLEGKAILLETAGEKILITPTDFDAFVAALQQATGK